MKEKEFKQEEYEKVKPMGSFKDGEFSGDLCPKCKEKMVYEMSFQDEYSYTSGHYTSDFPIIICDKCDIYYQYLEDYEEDNYEEEKLNKENEKNGN